jgi:hypothetical protein
MELIGHDFAQKSEQNIHVGNEPLKKLLMHCRILWSDGDSKGNSSVLHNRLIRG